jgi:adenylosuccinate synthase
MISSKTCVASSVAAPRASLRVTSIPAARRFAPEHHLALNRATAKIQRCSATPAEIEATVNAQVCVVLGTQWGDEGKGKLVDILAQGYDVVARAQVWIDARERSYPTHR